MNPQPDPTSPNRGFESLPVRHSSHEEVPGKPGKDAEDEEVQSAKWTQHFIRPLSDFMRRKGIQHTRVTITGGKANFELVGAGEPVLIYELVDATSEEQYFPLGVFFDLNSAVLKAQDHLPQRWDGDHVAQAISEIRARKIGLYGNSYAVLWRGEWHYDYDADEWKLVDQHTGTLEKPLPITRA